MRAPYWDQCEQQTRIPFSPLGHCTYFFILTVSMPFERIAGRTSSTPQQLSKLLGEREAKILEQSDVADIPDFQLAWLSTGMSTVIREIRRKWGHELLAQSQQSARVREKSWFSIFVNACQWRQRWSTATLPFRCLFMQNNWQIENDPRLLKMLYDMDAETQIMISLHLQDDTETNVLLTCAMVTTPDRQSIGDGGEKEDKLPFALWGRFLFDPDPAMLKPLCMTCDKLCRRTYRCSICRVQRYCSTSCQRRHWNKHKDSCAILRRLADQRDINLPD